MESAPGTVQNLNIKTDDGTAISYFDEVSGADGYCLFFYKQAEPDKCIKRRYADKSGKTVRGFINGVEYMASVSAYTLSEDGREVFGPESEKVPFTTMSLKLKVTDKLCMKVGETARIEYEYLNTKPDVVFESTNPDVAKVDATGNIMAFGKGETYIVTAMDEDNFAITSVSVNRGVEDKRILGGTIAFTGDIMCTHKHQKRAMARNFDFNPEFAKLKERLAFADLRIGVLETVTDPSSPYEYEQDRLSNGAPNCNSPVEFVSALKNTGFDVLITANNHNCDAGASGLKSTVTNIRNHNILNSGTYYDNPVYLNIGGVRVALISLCMINNGREAEVDDDPDRRNIGRYSRKLLDELMAAALADNADVKIVYMHWGNMNSHAVSESQRKEAAYIANAGADIIVGSHPHLIQSCEYITTEDGRNVLCAYSLGNLVTMMSEVRGNRDGVALIARIQKRAGEPVDFKFSFIPFYNDFNAEKYTVFPVDTSHIPVHLRCLERVTKALGSIVPLEKPRVICAGSDNLKKIIDGADFCRTDVFYRECTCRSFMEHAKNMTIDSNDYLLMDLYADACDPEFNPASVLPEFAEFIKAGFNQDHIILLRLNFDIRSVVKDQLRWGINRRALNEKLEFIEQVFIELVSPMVIDIADYYLSDVSAVDSDASAMLEPAFFAHARTILYKIINRCDRSYYFEGDTDIWMQRILKYYDNMRARKFYDWLICDDYAGLIIMNTSHGFVAEYQTDIKKLYELQVRTEEDLLYADISPVVLSAIKIINTVNSGNLLDSEADLRLMYEYGFNVCERYADILTGILDYPVSVKEIPYAQRFMDDREEYITRYAHKKANIDIWGSCISRTSVAVDEDIVVANYIFKQPPVLAFNPPMDVEISHNPADYENNVWRMNMIKSSFAHDGIARIEERGVNWIVVDLYDLICEVIKIGDDYLELDDFIKRTYVAEQMSGSGYRSYLFDEIFDDDARTQFRRFADYIKNKYDRNIILIRLDIKKEYVDLEGNMRSLREDPLFNEKKEYLEKYENMFIAQTGCHVIDVARYYNASDAFPLGGAHIVHYEKAFYEEVCSRIKAILEGDVISSGETGNMLYDSAEG